MTYQQGTRRGVIAAVLAIVALAGCSDEPSTHRDTSSVSCDAGAEVCAKYLRCLERQPAHLLPLCETLVD